MNYKNIFKLAFTIISSPAKAWEDISLEWDSQRVTVDFVYPMIGFCGLSYFIGSILERGWSSAQSFQSAMIDCCGIAVALFGGYYLAAYLINQISIKVFNLPDNLARALQLTGYSLVVTYMVHIILGIYPNFYIIALFLELYIFYIVFVGCPILFELKKSMKISYTLMSSLLIILCPELILFIYNKLTLLLN